MKAHSSKSHLPTVLFVDDEGGKLSSNGLYTTDKNGQIIIRDVTGTLVVTEVKAPDGT